MRQRLVANDEGTEEHSDAKKNVEFGTTNGVESWSKQMHASARFADCDFAVSTFSPPTAPSSASPASGLR
jgi:hypothetical protein